MKPPFPASGHADPKLTCQKSIQSGFSSVQCPKQRARRRLQPIRRKEEGEEQKYNPADGGRREKEGDTQHRQDHGGNRQQEGANIKQEHQQSRQKGQRQGERCNQYFQQYLHHQNLLYSFYLYFIMPARGHKCCERLVNPVPELRVNMARSIILTLHIDRSKLYIGSKF